MEQREKIKIVKTHTPLRRDEEEKEKKKEKKKRSGREDKEKLISPQTPGLQFDPYI